MRREMRRHLAREGWRFIGPAREATTTVIDCGCDTFEAPDGTRYTNHFGCPWADEDGSALRGELGRRGRLGPWGTFARSIRKWWRARPRVVGRSALAVVLPLGTAVGLLGLLMGGPSVVGLVLAVVVLVVVVSFTSWDG